MALEPEPRLAVDPSFIGLARQWIDNSERQFLGLVWQAYEVMRAKPPVAEGRDLERSITQLLEPRIRDVMTGDEPFYVQHSPFEHETMKSPPAQPPAYDLAFVLRADERIMWPLEAKVLETPGQIAAYVQEVKTQFLTCRYAPFSGSGAMLGYLLTGRPDEVFETIAARLDSVLGPVPSHPDRPNRLSRHARVVPAGKAYPADFSCYHLMLEYPDLRRSASASRG